MCLQRDIGESLSALETAVGSSIYPLFFCGTPDQRAELRADAARRRSTARRSTPATTSATDADGDGIADATDNCPTMFNPIRPMDNGTQADFDGDGAGRRLRPVPARRGHHAAARRSTRTTRDGDGVANATDNCPSDGEPDQADGDMDGNGDACDAVPDDANPGAAACPATIYDIKDGTVTGAPPLRCRTRW